MSGKLTLLDGVQKVMMNQVVGYACGPAKSAGAMVVLQEWWGVTDEIQRQALFMASKGYRCIIPDLYKGKIGVDAEEAQHLMGGLDFPNAVEEIKTTANYLKSEGSKKVGVMGFCMGGALALCSAVRLNGVIDCAIPFYGIPDKAYFDTTTVKMPVQCHFGEEDTMKGFSDPEAAAALKAALEASKCPLEFYMYGGVGHAFMNGMVPEWQQKKKALGFGDHKQEQVDLSWSRVSTFAAKHLSA